MLKLFKGLVIYLVFTVVNFCFISTLKAQTVYNHTFTSGSVSGSNYNQTPDLIAANLSVGSPQWTSSGTPSLSNCSGNQNFAVNVPNLGLTRTFTLNLNVASGYTLSLTGISAKIISAINNGGYNITVNGNAYLSNVNFSACPGQTITPTVPLNLTGAVSILINATNSGTASQNFAVDDFVLTGTVTLNSLNNLGISNVLAQSAYSLRKLRDTYTGAAIEVRRSSDNTTQNIAFTVAGNLDTTALKTFVGGSNGFVTIWYDQSGNGRNLTQTTASKQPTIVNAGVIFRKSTLPTIFFDATDDGMLFTGADYLTTNGFSVNLVAGSNSASTASRRAIQGNTLASNWLIGPYQNTHTWFAGGFNHQAATPWLTSQVERFTVIQASSVANTSFRNGTSITSANNKSTVPGKLYLGAEGGFAEPLDGFISELVSYSTELNTTDRQSMETSQATYYPISTNANLSALITTPTTTFSPTFTANTIAYTTTVANSTTTITVTPTREEANATIEVRVNGGAYAAVTSGNASGNLSLNVGANTIDVRVTAQDGTTIKTYTITVTRAANPPGNTLKFDGTDDFVNIPDNNNLDLTTNYTLESWINISVPSSLAGIVSKYHTVSSFGYLIRLSEFSPYRGINFDGLFTADNILETGKWYHIAAVKNGATRTLYINGIAQTLSGTGYTVVANTEPIKIGSDFNMRYFNGSIDEVRIWNTARTQAEIQANMFNSINAATNGLVAYYNFDNGIAGGTNTGQTTLADRTTNGNTGTLTNFGLTGATSNWLESYAMVVPTATSATSVTSTGFTANWTAPVVGTVTNYLLDVSTSSTFASFVSGYNSLSVSGTSQAVTGLNSLTTYYYRVRADKTSVTGQGGNSNTISPVTLVSANANLSALITTPTTTFSPTFTANTIAYTTTVANSTTTITVTPTREQANATIEVRVNGGTYASVTSGTASGNLSLNVGANTIDVRVTAQDGTTIKTYTITVTRAANAPGNTLKFDGTDDFVNIPDNNNLDLTTNYTLESWINISVPSSLAGIVSKLHVAGTNGYVLRLSFAAPYRGIDFDAFSTANDILETGKWYHIAAVKNGATRTLYINGIAQTLTGTGYTVAANNDPIKIGSDFNMRYFNGSIDEVRIWNTARTQAEIQANMFNSINASSSGLVAYYDFDNGIAGGTNTGQTTLADRTTNANTGTLTNFGLTGATSNWVESYAMVVPTATAATGVTSTGFTANWTAPVIGTVTNYLLDVSTSSTFASFVSGYNSLSVSGTSQAVTGLNSLTTYYYRVRADKTSVTGQGGNSNTIAPVTLVSANANLSALITTPTTTLTPTFTANTIAYTTTVANSTTTITVTPTREQANASIEVRVNGGAYASVTSGNASGNLSLNVGANTIDVRVTAQDGTTIKTYSLTVTRAAPSCIPTSSTLTISACGSYTWVANGSKVYIASNNIDTIKLVNAGGCDSIIRLNLTINVATTSTNSLAICSNQLPYTWNGLTFNTAGTQTRTGLVNSRGCDSSATLTLTVNSTTSSTNSLTICSNQLPYTWNGLTFTNAGTQTRTGLVNSRGCDSSATLTLTVNATTSSTNSLTICSNQLPYTWNGLTFTTAGTQTRTGLVNSRGCDSSATLTLTVNSTTSSTNSLTICSNQLPYTWNGLTFTAAGTQTRTGLVNSRGCDSSATLTLTVNATASSTNSLTICPSQLPYVWNGLTFTTAGTQTRTGLVSNKGCDSSATLTLTVSTTINSTNSLSICPNQLPYTWNGLTFTAAGTQTRTGLISSGGCDSSATLILTVNPNTSSTNNLTICSNQLPYTWNGLTFTAAGTQTRTGLVNSRGCDSSATLILTVNPTTSSNNALTICSNQLPFVWNGLTFTTAGTQTRTGLVNSRGCDSSATLTLTVNATTSSTNALTICSNQLPFVWNGLTFTAAGTQTRTGLINSRGCDSSATLTLTVNPTTSSTNSLAICPSQFPYTWNGLTFTSAGTQTRTGLVNSRGCDSSATLTLTVNPNTSSTSNIAICPNQLPFVWNGLTFTAAGTQTRTGLINSRGCDSSATLILTVNATTSSTNSLTICSNQLPYTWNGLTFTAAGTQTRTGLVNSRGCDSSATLTLTVNSTTSSINALTICSNQLPFVWNGLTFTAAGTQTRTGLINSRGCDSSATLTLTVNATTSSTNALTICSNQLPFIWNGLTFTAAGTQTRTGLINSRGCDSSATLTLTVNATTSSNNALSICTTQLPFVWNGLTFTVAGTQTRTGLVNSRGCDSSATLTLTVNSTTSSNNALSICTTQLPFVWNGLTFTTAGTQTRTGLINSRGCDSSATLTLTVNATTSSTNALTICSNQLPFVWNGLTFTTAGTQTRTGLVNSKGCDSSATLTLTVNATTSSTNSLTICSSQLPFVWNGLTFTAAGTRTRTGLINSRGCDSSATLTLTVNATTISNNALTICSTQLPFVWNGLTFTAAGTQTRTGLVNSRGCDSSATLTLTVNATTSSTNNLTICPNQLPYTWDGFTFTAAGTRIKTSLINSRGCDSTATFNLTVANRFNVNLGRDTSICSLQVYPINTTVVGITGAVYAWNSSNGFNSNNPVVNLSTTGSYWVRVTDATGCSIADTFNLTVSTRPIDAEIFAATQIFARDTVTIVNISKHPNDSITWNTFANPNITVVRRNNVYLDVVFSTVGQYTIGLTSSAGNCKQSATKIINVQPAQNFTPPTGQSRDPFIRLYTIGPNPNRGTFNVNIKLADISNIRLRMVRVDNNTVVRDNLYSGLKDYNLPYNVALPSGVYVLILETQKGSMVQKIVIN